MQTTVSIFPGGVHDTSIVRTTASTFESFSALAAHFEGIDPGVSEVPVLAALGPQASADEERAFKATLAPSKKRVCMFSPFTFGAGATTKLRESANAMSVLVLEIDADFGSVKSSAVQAAAMGLRWRYFVYSTFSHRDARPCLRFVFELSRPASAVRVDSVSEADRVRAGAIAMLGGAAFFDAGDSGFHYFVPSCPDWAMSEAVFETVSHPSCIDVDALLRRPVPERLVTSARSSGSPARTAPVTTTHLASFIAQQDRRVWRGTDPRAERRIEVAQAILSGLAIPGVHRDTALNSFYRAFRYWFADRHGEAAPCPQSMGQLCASTREATAGLSRPPTCDTFEHWNLGHDADMVCKREHRARELAASREWLRGVLDEPEPVRSPPAQVRSLLGLA